MTEDRFYEVSWTIEVEGSSFEDAAYFVAETYGPSPIDSDGWTFVVTDRGTSETQSVQVKPAS